jgi:hypothetical protein
MYFDPYNIYGIIYITPILIIFVSYILVELYLFFKREPPIKWFDSSIDRNFITFFILIWPITIYSIILMVIIYGIVIFFKMILCMIRDKINPLNKESDK